MAHTVKEMNEFRNRLLWAVRHLPAGHARQLQVSHSGVQSPAPVVIPIADWGTDQWTCLRPPNVARTA